MALLPALDTPTMMVTVVVGTLSMAAAMVFVRPDRREGMGLWALALLLHAITYALFLARGQVSDWFSIVLANVVLAGTFALLLAAITEFHARALPWAWMLAPIPISAALMAWSLHDYRLRLLASSFILAAQIGMILWALWRPKPPGQPRGAILISAALGVQGALMLARGLWYVVNTPAQQNITGSGTAQSITFLSAFIVVLLASLGFILMTKDRAEAINRDLANNDMLTGVPNRRLLQQTLKRDAMRAMREHAPYAVMMVDIDHFKAVNDTHGHLAGDAVLRHVAHLLEARVRGQDMVGRWGGEEFLVLLPATTLDGARQLAETLRGCVCDAPCHYEGRPIPTTISIGICAEALEPGDRPRLLVDAADRALYAAKAAGRNRVADAPLARTHELHGARPAPARH